MSNANPGDILVFEIDCPVKAAVDLKQYLACKASVASLSAEIASTEYGVGYSNLLSTRLADALRQMANIEAKYAKGIPNSAV